MRRLGGPLLARWAFALITAAVVATSIVDWVAPPAGVRATFGEALWALVPLGFTVVGALIIARRPGNAIGLLMLLPGALSALPFESYLRRFPAPPESPSPAFLTLLWFQSWSWLLLLMPVLFVLLLFPSGRLPGPRWRWVAALGLVVAAATVLLGTFAQEWGPIGRRGDLDWTVVNPIGFLSRSWIDRYFDVAFFVALPSLILLCVASVFVRYRRAGPVERIQIRWLLYACVVFAVMFVLLSVFDVPGGVWDVVFTFGFLAIPAGIAVAILRHRLYDIDVIIRRTLQYGVLTAILGGLYFGSVLLVQTLLEPLVGGADSPPVVMVTTLALAALFNPLRVRVQRFIDRRFYRRRVDAERALARFAALARDELDLEQLRAALLGTLGETLQPVRMGLWLRPVPADRALGSTR